MEIKRNDPPGRPNRKLRGHLEVINQLHSEGYSIRGIRKVLIDSGVVICSATVHREVARLKQSPATATTRTPTVTRNAAVSDALNDPADALQTKKSTTSRPTADEFFSTYIDNPLFHRTKKS
jgi:hypothetical protein